MTKIIQLTDAQWADWQAAADYRAGFQAGAFGVVADDVQVIELYRPDAQLLAKVKRSTAWVAA
jgi:hypothetical protein